jgi:hypothetical protein
MSAQTLRLWIRQDEVDSGMTAGVTAVHDLTAARIWGIIQALAACGLVPLSAGTSYAQSSGRAPPR